MEEIEYSHIKRMDGKGYYTKKEIQDTIDEVIRQNNLKDEEELAECIRRGSYIIVDDNGKIKMSFKNIARLISITIRQLVVKFISEVSHNTDLD
ncbi:MAG: hypothetical protein FWE37_05770 [Spirochaetaceae bacterium]|nr:hypothetical protein [Spirochaetaceae bacterium]